MLSLELLCKNNESRILFNKEEIWFERRWYKINYKIILPIIIIAGSITVGTAFAITTFDSDLGETPVVVDGGNVNIVDGGMIFTRTDGIQTVLVVRNDVAQTAIIFEDVDTGSQYILRHTSDGARFDFLDFDGAAARVDLAIQRSTGNIGIGTVNPLEDLDVNGNIRLTGNIVSPNDICIGNCP